MNQDKNQECGGKKAYSTFIHRNEQNGFSFVAIVLRWFSLKKWYGTYWHIIHLPVIGSHGPPLHGHLVHFEFTFIGVP